MMLDGKNAVVTGSSRGIGRATALALAKQGANVVVNYVKSSEAAESLADEIKNLGRKCVVVKADVSVADEAKELVKSAIDELGGVDILVNNAGVSMPAMLLKMSEEQWDRILAIHLKGTFLCTQAAALHMKDKKAGKIINITSTAGVYGTIGQVNYASAKAGIIGFTKSASRELGRYNINVNAVCAGVIETDMTEKVQTDEKLRNIYLGRIQLGRFGKPEDVANAVLFLASSASDYITGHVLMVDGGYVG